MAASYLRIGGALVQDAILTSVTVTQELNHHTWCSIECRQTADRRFPFENALGKDLQILTYDENRAENTVFEGFVVKSKLHYEIYGSFLARITGVTRSYKLDLRPREAYYRKAGLSQIASSLTGPVGLSAAVRCPALPPHNYVQWGETDFAFLQRLADGHGAWMRPTAQGVEIADTFSPGGTLRWREEDQLFTFTMQGRLAAAAFRGTHYDPRRMQSAKLPNVSRPASFLGASGPLVDAVQRESRSKLPVGAVCADERAASADEFRRFLESESERSMTGALTGRGVSRAESLRAGDTVKIDGPMDAAGTYGLVKVIHHWVRTGYHNEFWCTPAASYRNPERPAGAPMRGVVPARIVSHNDPRGMGRVQVQYDWQTSGATGWARMATPHAGQDRGFHFLPEVGDEVLVAFEQGDAERPYVLGALWNGVDHAPRDEFWGQDVEPNEIKRIVTKSGHRIQLGDKPGKEAIVLATPKAVKIGLMENADETGRPMLVAHSAGDIFFNAPNGRIHFRSATFSREVGTSGSLPQGVASAPPPPPAPRPDFAAQAASLRQASATGAALCKPCPSK